MTTTYRPGFTIYGGRLERAIWTFPEVCGLGEDDGVIVVFVRNHSRDNEIRAMIGLALRDVAVRFADP